MPTTMIKRKTNFQIEVALQNENKKIKMSVSQNSRK